MSYIRAKYPKVGNEYIGYQGIGSLNGGNVISDSSNINSERTNEFINESGETFALRTFSRAFSSAFDSYNFIK